jgi:hypothetical protein
METAQVDDIPVIFARPAASSVHQVQIRIQPGLDHLGAGRDQGVEEACFDWLTAEDGGRGPRL